MKRKYAEYVGNKINHWTIISYDGNRYCTAKCDCGREKLVDISTIVSGKSRSCRKCRYYKDNLSASMHKHGLSDLRIYPQWISMMEGCYNEDHPKYKVYGAKGITVCDEWHDIHAFYEWAKKNGYKEHPKGYTQVLKRLDKSKGFSPDNCRYGRRNQTMSEIQQSRTGIDWSTTTHTMDGETRKLSEWCAMYGIEHELFYTRTRRGMTFDEAIKTPKQKRPAKGKIS